MKKFIEKLIESKNLTREEMMEAMNLIMTGQVNLSQIAGFLIALRMKGETVEEIVGGAEVMKEQAKKLQIKNSNTIDTCGTGGDGVSTFNISTAVAFVAAAAGVTVVKHGNRAVSSKCGSADVLEKLGINISTSQKALEELADHTNLAFVYAPDYHQAMKHAIQPRKDLGIRTIFNILGPLSNPANVSGQLLGTYDPSLTSLMAEALRCLGSKRAMVVHGSDGLDEISITGPTDVAELKEDKIINYKIDPRDYGLSLGKLEEIRGGTAEENARIIRDLLGGTRGAKRDILLMNAGAAIYIGEKSDSLAEGIQRAIEVVDSGLGIKKLDEYIGLSQKAI